MFQSNEAVIQYQDNGNWLDAERIPNQSQLILEGMRRTSEVLGGLRRIRAVDETGRVLDIL